MAKKRILKAKQTMEKKKRKADKEKLKTLRSLPSRKREIPGLNEAQTKPSAKSDDRDLNEVIEVLEREEDPRWKFYEDTREGDDEERRRLNMLNIYDSTKSFPKSETTCTELVKIIRRSVIPQVKFWNEGDGKFGSDEKPDFTEKNYWGNKMFDQVAGTMFESDGAKAIAWTSYREDLKKVFVGHRSIVTRKMKAAFIECE